MGAAGAFFETRFDRVALGKGFVAIRTFISVLFDRFQLDDDRAGLLGLLRGGVRQDELGLVLVGVLQFVLDDYFLLAAGVAYFHDQVFEIFVAAFEFRVLAFQAPDLLIAFAQSEEALRSDEGHSRISRQDSSRCYESYSPIQRHRPSL